MATDYWPAEVKMGSSAMSLGGNVCVRNGFELDYCFRESIESLLPICDVVNVCDSDSTDGTREALEHWSKSEPKLRILNYPWTDPVANPFWILDWENFSRKRLGTDYHILLEADEVLHEESYPEVLAAVQSGQVKVCRRLNFWKDATHLVPPGHWLSPDVIRLAPTGFCLYGDTPHPNHQDAMSQSTKSGIQIGHYGFLRRPKAYIKKRHVMNRLFWGGDSADNTLSTVIEDIQAGRNWADRPWFGEEKLVDFTGTHPARIKPWLKERGYSA